ncbi:hypothetical protein STRTUCAR8_06200 [Streptomyces turgidiscabies Car8]|uniref:Uncharacterized protein n=2 Tax=Streptomyces TaxID=1883 RepID=L7F8B0_STRT8|nr:hypothetical protein STRTUCAR8_06200 [Streptomyces turgidiscabies Car8]
MRTDPSPAVQSDRHHQLRFDLTYRDFRGERLPQWQIEVTGGGRIWYVIDEERRIVWLMKASLGHPKATE